MRWAVRFLLAWVCAGALQQVLVRVEPRLIYLLIAVGCLVMITRWEIKWWRMENESRRKTRNGRTG